MITTAQIVDVLRTITDPETEMDIVELLLVNDILIQDEGHKVVIDMGFQRKNPDCKACVPLAWYIQQKLIQKIENRIGQLAGVESVEVLSN